MGIFDSINIATTGLNAEKLRMDTISRNIANAQTTRTANGAPYRRKVVVMREIPENSFASYLNKSMNSAGGGVEVTGVVDDMSPLKLVYNPNHPDADERGYVSMPNVDTVTEMVNMIAASRAYEANLTTINTSKSMMMKALELNGK